jgi:two-component system response regulator YesN
MPKANVMMLCIQLGFCIHKAVYEVSDSPEADKFLTTQLIGSRVFPTREYVLRMSLEAKDIISNQRKQNSEVLCDRAMHIIENEYGDETLSLANISERLHVSASYLSAILRKNRGDTFVNLLTAKRMTAAREFLMCTSMKIMEVARRCGYSDQHYFSYCFKRYYGTSPNKVRKNVKVDQPAD